MGTRKLTEEQALAADNLQNARARFNNAKSELKREFEQLLEQRLEKDEDAVSDAIKQCQELGMSMAAIMRAYGTSDYRTVKDYIDRNNSSATGEN